MSYRIGRRTWLSILRPSRSFGRPSRNSLGGFPRARPKPSPRRSSSRSCLQPRRRHRHARSLAQRKEAQIVEGMLPDCRRLCSFALHRRRLKVLPAKKVATKKCAYRKYILHLLVATETCRCQKAHRQPLRSLLMTFMCPQSDHYTQTLVPVTLCT